VDFVGTRTVMIAITRATGMIMVTKGIITPVTARIMAITDTMIR